MTNLVYAAPVISGSIDAPQLIDEPFDELSDPRALGENRFSFGLGFSSGSILEKGESQSALIYTLNYRNSLDPRRLEVDIWIHSQAMAGIFLGTRWPASQDSPWMVYYKASGGMYLPAKDGPTAIAAIKRLQARATLGWENFYDYERRLQAEIGIGASVVGFELFTSGAYIWSF